MINDGSCGTKNKRRKVESVDRKPLLSQTRVMCVFISLLTSSAFSNIKEERERRTDRPLPVGFTMEEESLGSLLQWLTPTAFEGSTREAIMRQHTRHYGEFVRSHLDIEWPAYDGSDDGKCSICGNIELHHYPEGNLTDRGEIFCRSSGACFLETHGRAPHVAHRECYLAGYLDSLLINRGMMMSQDAVRLQPSNIDKSKLLERFDIIDGTCRLKDFPSECLFCKAQNINNDTLEELREYGFRELPESPLEILELQCPGSYSPFPVGGTVVLRPSFDSADSEKILKHAIIGTFVDFDGYRAMDLHVVVSSGESRNKALQKLHFDDAGYAIVPQNVTKLHGVLKLTTWPPSLTQTLSNICLPGSNDMLTNSDFLGLEGPLSSDFTIQSVSRDDDLYIALENLKLWVESLPISSDEDPLPKDKCGRDDEKLQDEGFLRQSRQQWKSGILEGIEKMCAKLVNILEHNTHNGPQVYFLQELRNELESLYAPTIAQTLGNQVYRVDYVFSRLWSNCKPLSWDDTAMFAFQSFCRRFISLPNLPDMTVSVHLARCPRQVSGTDDLGGVLNIGLQTSGPIEAQLIPLDVCCREGYYDLYMRLQYAGSGWYAMEYESPYACSKYIVVDTSKCNAYGGVPIYLSHDYTLDAAAQLQLQQVDAAAIGTIQEACRIEGITAERDDSAFQDALHVLAPNMELPRCSMCDVPVNSSVPIDLIQYAVRQVNWRRNLNLG